MTRTKIGLVGLVGLCGLLAAACVDKGPGKHQKKIDPAYVQEHLLSEVPTMAHPMNGTAGADFDGKVLYLGNNVSTDTLKPGGKITIDHYWKVVQPPGGEWRIFAHVNGAKPQDWMNVDYTDMRVGYPASKWQAGDIIHDEQKFALSKSWSSPYADVMVGLYRKGGRSVKDRMPILSGPADDQQRLKVLHLTVDLGGGVVASNKYVVRRATGPITIDGKPDEADWKSAPESPDFSAAEGGPTAAAGTSARLLWDDDNLYLFVDAKDPDVSSQYEKDDDPLWKEDCVEMFVDADRNGRGYVELQVNPNNAKFDSWFANTRREGGDEAWNAGMKSAVAADGTGGWQAEVAIPLAAVKGRDDAMKVTLPPAIGDQWRLNVVAIDKPKDGTMKVSSWNPITMADFHALGRMLTVTFGDAEGKVAATDATPAEGATSAEPGAPTAPTATKAEVRKDRATLNKTVLHPKKMPRPVRKPAIPSEQAP